MTKESIESNNASTQSLASRIYANRIFDNVRARRAGVADIYEIKARIATYQGFLCAPFIPGSNIKQLQINLHKYLIILGGKSKLNNQQIKLLNHLDNIIKLQDALFAPMKDDTPKKINEKLEELNNSTFDIIVDCIAVDGLNEQLFGDYASNQDFQLKLQKAVYQKLSKIPDGELNDTQRQIKKILGLLDCIENPNTNKLQYYKELISVYGRLYTQYHLSPPNSLNTDEYLNEIVENIEKISKQTDIGTIYRTEDQEKFLNNLHQKIDDNTRKYINESAFKETAPCLLSTGYGRRKHELSVENGKIYRAQDYGFLDDIFNQIFVKIIANTINLGLECVYYSVCAAVCLALAIVCTLPAYLYALCCNNNNDSSSNNNDDSSSNTTFFQDSGYFAMEAIYSLGTLIVDLVYAVVYELIGRCFTYYPIFTIERDDYMAPGALLTNINLEERVLKNLEERNAQLCATIEQSQQGFEEEQKTSQP